MARRMSTQLSFIISDLHLGSEFFYREKFLSWLDGLVPEAQLILNGDIIDDPAAALGTGHKAVLERLVQESHQRPLVWIYGNHDANVVLEDPGRIQFAHQWAIGRRLLVMHGNTLDKIMPRHRLFKKFFRLFHRVLMTLGFQKMHVAQYAKKWAFFYQVLNRHVAAEALRAARENGFEAVTCGHTHAAMDIRQDGRRYLNTGAWTEEPLHYIAVNAEEIGLHVYDGRLV